MKGNKEETGARNQEPEEKRQPSILTSDSCLLTSGVNPFLVVRDLWKAYPDATNGRTEVLRGICLSVAAGELVAVMGASGTGKSTLLHVLGGLEAADSGSVRVGDFEVSRAAHAEVAHFRNETVGFVFQSHRLLLDLSAIENVALPLLIARRKWPEALGRAEELLRCVGLGACATRKASQLSGGEQQRIAVARALVTRPRLVLADEPTGNLDEQTADEVGALLASLAREQSGAAVVIATHNERLARLCDRVLRLHDGRLQAKES
ncbi:MAG: ABC transporter ATP-binding protein [Pyrinomonadaceae bacterium]|nr:ABC transporter ATP-binding protein [Pyrinomonadaceae bacterium]